ncbi:hypothetical protein ACLKA6_014569 [Drosophila palustris]
MEAEDDQDRSAQDNRRFAYFAGLANLRNLLLSCADLSWSSSASMTTAITCRGIFWLSLFGERVNPFEARDFLSQVVHSRVHVAVAPRLFEHCVSDCPSPSGWQELSELLGFVLKAQCADYNAVHFVLSAPFDLED